MPKAKGKGKGKAKSKAKAKAALGLKGEALRRMQGSESGLREPTTLLHPKPRTPKPQTPNSLGYRIWNIHLGRGPMPRSLE